MSLKSMVVLIGFIGAVVFAISIITLTFAPAILLIFGAWEGFSYWFPIVMFLSRVMYFFSIFISILLFLSGKVNSLITGIIDVVMVIWGIPVYQNAVMSLAYTPLTGMELQRTILLIIFIEAMCLSKSLMSKVESSGDDD